MHSYREKISGIHRTLGIPVDYETRFGLPFFIEAKNLQRIEDDVFLRPQFLESACVEKWNNMKLAAEKEHVVLQVVSAFRSVEYQTKLIQTKLDKGLLIEEILKVNAAPGYSEHHSGCALDLTTIGSEPLANEFEETEAFGWLSINARHFGFSLSYPKDSKSKIMYEPWHWACLSLNSEPEKSK